MRMTDDVSAFANCFEGNALISWTWGQERKLAWCFGKIFAEYSSCTLWIQLYLYSASYKNVDTHVSFFGENNACMRSKRPATRGYRIFSGDGVSSHKWIWELQLLNWFIFLTLCLWSGHMFSHVKYAPQFLCFSTPQARSICPVQTESRQALQQVTQLHQLGIHKPVLLYDGWGFF